MKLLAPSMMAAAMVLALVPVSDASTPAGETAAKTVRISLARTGEPNNISGRSSRPAVDTTGNVVAFDSIATNLVPRDTNRDDDVFVRDRMTNKTERVSVSSAGKQGNDASSRPSVSGDGNLVAFDSIASNLVAGGTNTCEFGGGPLFEDPGECPDIVVRDRTLDVTTRVSVSGGGGQANDASTDPAISFDGRSGAFFTTASNLGPLDTNTCPPFFNGHPGQCPDIYLHRR